MRKDLSLQFDLLENSVEQLNQPIVMLNVLHNRTDLDRIETSELEQLLKGIESLLQRQANEIQERIDVILEWGGEEATMSKANNLYVLDEQAQQCLKDGINIL